MQGQTIAGRDQPQTVPEGENDDAAVFCAQNQTARERRAPGWYVRCGCANAEAGQPTSRGLWPSVFVLKNWNGQNSGIANLIKNLYSLFWKRRIVRSGRCVVGALVAAVAPQILFWKAPDQGLHRPVDGFDDVIDV